MPTAAKMSSISGLKGARLNAAQRLRGFRDGGDRAGRQSGRGARRWPRSRASICEPDGLRYVSFIPTIRPTRGSGTCRRSTSRRPGTSIRAATTAWSSRCSTRASPTRPTSTACSAYDGRTLRNIDVPVAAANDLATADRFVSPFDFIWGDNEPSDFDGHGTHVAGTIGQLTNNNSACSASRST